MCTGADCTGALLPGMPPVAKASDLARFKVSSIGDSPLAGEGGEPWHS
jgi:hypothetical protein